MSAEERMDTEEEGGDNESPNCDESDIEDSDRSTTSETESSGLNWKIVNLLLILTHFEL